MAARLRFRAIMMTSLAFIVALIPLVTAKGASEIARHNVSMPVFAGMIGAATIGIFLIPMLYVVFQTMREWAHSRSGRKDPEATLAHPETMQATMHTAEG
jgi:Cu/Ag efflux pump CusA